MPGLKGVRNLNTLDIPGAQPKRTLKVKGLKRFNFFPELPEIENLLTKDKNMIGITRIWDQPKTLLEHAQ